MDNNDFENFTNQDFKNLSNWLDDLDPYEFAVVGVIAAFLIAPTLTTNEQNSIGNFLEEIGQILLTICAQNQTNARINQSNAKFTNNSNNNSKLEQEINKLKKEIEDLKRTINNS